MTVGGGPRRSAGAGYESEGRRFESCRARHRNTAICSKNPQHTKAPDGVIGGFGSSRLSKSFLKGCGGYVSHSRHDVRVCVHRLRNRGVSEGLPRDAAPDDGKGAGSVLEGPRTGQPVLYRHHDALQREVRLNARSLGGLARDRARLETRRALLDEESSEFVILVAGPDDDHIGHRAVSDPAFLAIYNVLVALPTGLRLDHHCI